MLIAGIGTAVPAHRISHSDSAAIAVHFATDSAEQSRLFKLIYRRAEVRTRHSVVLDSSDGDLESRQTFYGPSSPSTTARMIRYEQEAPALALEASRNALKNANVAPERVTHLITVSCTGFYAPGWDCQLATQLPLPPNVARTHVGFMGCQGVLNGLRVARAFAESDPSACVLLCSTELCSLHHYYGWDPEKIVANSLFADGSAAVLLTSQQFVQSQAKHGLRMVASGSTLISDSDSVMSWRIGDNGFEMTLSARVPSLISETIRPWLQHWLQSYGQDVDSIQSWAVHPGGPRILSAFGESMGLPRTALADSYDVLHDYGNMSSATMLFILEKLFARNAPVPMVAVGFGPGMTIEAALFV